ncbi:TatD family hydrolase [Photobacterium galatheae]|uniref:Deoxyribonuclease n=1 Tax=Photobacterium galatheae TaxID=1654360 RepID=A0A066RNB4_9GAMM|nr:deoxyribonuclease [Photobacterium galatheae]MCM0147745.1 TatD family hydrolase [Photobacterium galatheae]
MIDSHCHFDFPPFADNSGDYLDLARQAGVSHIVIPSVGERNWQQVKRLCEAARQPGQPALFYALGMHPYFAEEHGPETLARLEQALEQARDDPCCVAVGECGLDFAIPDADRQQQMDWLVAQLSLANQYNLPVILHCRKAFPELLQCLKCCPPIRGGVYHAFSGSLQQAIQLLDLGIKIGVGGTITYRRANKTRTTIAQLPLDALLLETDAPDMPPAGFQGEPNRPDRVVQVLNALAELRSESVSQLAQATHKNAEVLFALPSHI